MLKLNTVNGKFDIVFSGDPLVGGNQNPGFTCGSSAARRKFKEKKSHVLPKEQVPKGGRLKKDIPTKNNNSHEKIKEPISQGKRHPKRAPEKNVDKNLVNKTKIKNVEKNINRKEVKEKEAPILSVNKKEINKKESSARIKKEQVKKGKNPAGQVEKKENSVEQVEKNKNTVDNIATKEDKMRNNKFDIRGSNVNNAVTDNTAGYITREDLNEMFRGFFEATVPVKIVEPVNEPVNYPVKTVQPVNEPVNYPVKTVQPVNVRGSNDFMDLKDTFHGFSQKSHPVETVEPLNIPGLGSAINSMTPIKGSNSPKVRDNAIRDLQASQEMDYNPWGRPGCGAPLKDKDHNVLADLKKYKSEINRSQSYSDRSVKIEVDHTNKLHSSLNLDNTSPLQPDVFSTYARGQGKSQFELEDLQKRRMKELEHQNAIKEQVEEKRRIKRLEKERELREEQQAEARFQKEQERILEIAEKERRKQQEQEEKMRKQQQILEDGIKRANLESKRLKESMKPNYSRRNNAGEVKHSNFTEEPIPYSQRRLHRDDDVIVPANKFRTTDEKILNGNRFDDGFDSYFDSDYDSEKANRTFIQEPSGREFISDHGMDSLKKNNSRNNKSERFISISDVDSERNDETLYQSSKKQVSNDHHYREKKKDGKTKTVKSSDKDTLSESNIAPTFQNIFNDYLVPYHRTETTELIENHNPPVPVQLTETAELIQKRKPLIPVTRTETEELIENYKPLLTSEFKKNFQEKRIPDGQHQFTQSSQSSRQQQILNQLHALRQGLMQKEREYMEKSG